MFTNPAWTVDVTRVLTRRELATVLADARAQAERSLNAQRNLVIVRLACCCGLRVSEIGALRLDDVNVDGARPHIRLRRETTKGKKARCVPLWWDAGTLTDLAEWQAERIGMAPGAAIRQKAEIMVDHFHTKVHRKIGGKARAMVVCSGIARAVQYYHAIATYLKERNSPYRAIVAFSGEYEDGGRKVTEATLNEFPSSKIESKFKEDPYRLLVVANKFQTGYDEPLLHTMYVDKQLSGITAVQTLSRLNRAHPQKSDTFVLDFMNDTDTITKAFADYYRTTILSQETDPDRLHDLKGTLDGSQVYSLAQVEELSRLFIGGARRDTLDPILDVCVHRYLTDLDLDGQVDFKGKAKAFVRAYQFLAAILPYTVRAWEELSTFLSFLIPKLPAPVEEDLSKGILESIDMESYRNEVKEAMKLTLPDENAEIDPVPTSGGGGKPPPELDKLSNIIKSFNDLFGNIDWKDADRIRQVIAEEIPGKVAADKAYQNAMKNSDKAAARLEHDRALQAVVIGMLSDHTELFKQFSDNPGFKKWLADTIFNATYDDHAA